MCKAFTKTSPECLILWKAELSFLVKVDLISEQLVPKRVFLRVLWNKAVAGMLEIEHGDF